MRGLRGKVLAAAVFFALTFDVSAETTFVVEDREGYNAWPVVTTLGEKLVITYSRGKGHDCSEGCRDAIVRTSVDGARSWSPERVFAGDPDICEGAEGSGHDSKGNILFWLRCWGKRRITHELYRSADAVRFERIAVAKLDPFPMQLMDVVNVPDLGLVTLWFAGDYRSQCGHSWGYLVSKDDGLTWKQVVVERDLDKADWPTEPSLVSLGDGRLFAMARSESSGGKAGKCLMSLYSADLGKTWMRSATAITDVLESTPALLCDATVDELTLYYFQRGAALLKKRTAKVSKAIAEPMSAWSAAEIVAYGRKDRPYDSGNVKAVRHCGSDYLAYYAGDPTNATVLVSVVGKGETPPDSLEGRRILFTGDVDRTSVREFARTNRCEALVYPTREEAYRHHPVGAFANERGNVGAPPVPECAFAYLHDEDFQEPGLETMRRLVGTLGAEGSYNFLTLTLRCPGHDLSEPETWACIGDVAKCAHENRLKLIVDCDPRISRTEFLKRWPDEAQELAIVGTNGMPASAWACPRLVDHMSAHGPYAPTATREKPFPGGKTVIHTLRSADLFSPRTLEYAHELSRRAKDVGADGALRDEWGFPPSNDRIFEEHRAFWYSRRLAEAYAAETGGRDLLADLPLLAFGPSGATRRALIAAYMRLIYRRNVEIERDFYEKAKRIFGPEAFVGKHPTWFPVIGTCEFMHNGLDWWAAPRDWAQGDEVTPVPALCGMAKKFGTGVWLNEGYQDAPEKYAPLVWRYALAGGRMVFHPVYPETKVYGCVPYRDWKVRTHGDVLKHGGAAAGRRVRLLNRISDAPIDSPAVLVFGHERVMNWDDPAYGQWGWNDAFGVWKDGYAVDAYPSTELGSFRVDGAGFLCVGRQRYLAVMVRNLSERDRAAFAGLAQGRALQTRIFEGSDGVADYLSSVKAPRQTPICRTLPPAGWTAVYPQPDGTLVLTDGTVARLKASGPNWGGDPIEGVLEVGGARVEYSAEGVFAARLGSDGKLEAFAGGNLRRVSGPGFSRTFEYPRDMVMKRTAEGWIRLD